MTKGKCRINGDELVECIDLGDQYVTDFVDKGAEKSGEISSLKIGIGKTSGLAQLYNTYPPDKMYRKYWYMSRINESMRRELNDIVNSACEMVKLNDGDIVLDIASNDGTMLSFYSDKLKRIGIDPSDVARDSEIYSKNNINLINNYFKSDIYNLHVNKKKAKIITVISMFYDLDDPNQFLSEVRDIIDDNGLLIIQLGYTPLMLEQNEFGFISHEHVCYYTLKILNKLLQENGFEIIDAQLNDTNGGSIRIYSVLKNNKYKLNCPLNYFSIGQYRKESILGHERNLLLDTVKPYIEFMERIENLKVETINWLRQQKENGKLVIGYGASTKGNVLLQYYNINSDLLPYIAERTEKKWGLCTIGTGIPIISEEEMRKMKPDYLFALPWFFIKSFLNREKELISGGTKFVTPQPDLKIW